MHIEPAELRAIYRRIRRNGCPRPIARRWITDLSNWSPTKGTPS